MRERLLIALGGLLHDIGKFLQRAGKDDSQSLRAKDKEHFGYAHASLSYEATEEILDKLGIEDKDDRKLVLSACFHHKPDTKHDEADNELFPVRALFRLADWYASVERSKELDEEDKEEFKRLKPVFEKVDIGRGSSSEPFIYKLAPLSIEGKDGYPDIFPVSKKEADDYVQSKGDELYEEYYGRYKDLYEGFMSSISNGSTLKSIEHKLSYLYHTLYKYTWCVPASIYDRENYHSHYPDISLFDHSRVVSALATSLYTKDTLELLKDYRDSERSDFANSLKIYIFEGDISGIQKFIYDIANVKGVAKRLRGRSVFLSFLPELVGRFILRELGYPWTNLLYAGGGKFQAIVGFEEGIEEKIGELADEVDRALVSEFGGKLGFVVYGRSLKLSELERYPEIVKDLMERGLDAKKRKFRGVIDSFDELANRYAGKEVKACPSCRWELIEDTGDEEKTCRLCENFKNLGDAVVKSNILIFSEKPLKGGKGIYLEGIGGVYLSRNVRNGEDYSDAFILNYPERLGDISGITGFRFLANVVPHDEEGIKSFEELMEEAEGDKKLSFVLADVDNLGFIFMKGLKEFYTISRVATLSRSLDLFFSGYLNTLFSKDEYKDRIYTLYAGGDDLSIVAPWDIAIKVMKEVREAFGYFVCGNPSFGLSCGMFTSGGNYPVRLAFERVKAEEARAKSIPEKDAVSLLGEAMRWEELDKVLSKADEVAQRVGEKELGRTNLYRIYLLLRQYRELEKEKDDRKYMFYPYFYYYLSRNVKDEHRKPLENLFLNTEEDYKVRDSAIFVAKYILMKTREVRT